MRRSADGIHLRSHLPLVFQFILRCVPIRLNVLAISQSNKLLSDGQLAHLATYYRHEVRSKIRVNAVKLASLMFFVYPTTRLSMPLCFRVLKRFARGGSTCSSHVAV